MLTRLSRLKLPAVYWLVALAFVLRLVARPFNLGIHDFWVNGYRFFFEIAQSIAQGHGIGSADGTPETYRVPFYAIVLAGLTLGHQTFWPIAIAESAIGAGIAFCAALLARFMFSGPHSERAAALAAGIAAIYPYYVIHDTALEETSLFTLLTIIATIVLMKAARSESDRVAPGALAGLVLGLDVLTRLAIVPVALLAPLWLIWQKRVRAGITCAIILPLVVLPWIWRNYLITGTPTLSTESGLQFWSGNNGYLFRYYPRQSRDVSTDEALRSLSAQDEKELQQLAGDDVATDRWFRHKGFLYIRAHPWETIRDGFRKNIAGFSWLPSPRRGTIRNVIHALSYGPVMLLGLWGMWRRRAKWREDSLIYLQFASFVLITAAYWAHTSHRSYLDVYWIVFGAGAIAETHLLRRRRANPARETPDMQPTPR